MADPFALALSALVAALPAQTGARALALVEILGASGPHFAASSQAAAQMLREAMELADAVAALRQALADDAGGADGAGAGADRGPLS
jgi:hypothetical protein